jgi:hypothetical protein
MITDWIPTTLRSRDFALHARTIALSGYKSCIGRCSIRTQRVINAMMRPAGVVCHLRGLGRRPELRIVLILTGGRNEAFWSGEVILDRMRRQWREDMRRRRMERSGAG